MIEKLFLENFKCFETLNLPLSKLNVLSGLNGVGKSTVIQSLLLLRQSINKDEVDALSLNGEYINLGTGKDVLYEKGDETKGITFEFGSKNKDNFIWNFTYNSDASQLPIKKSYSMTENKLELFTDNFCYLSSIRIAPQDFYRTPDLKNDSLISLGLQGQYVSYYLSTLGKKPLKNKNVIIGNIEDENQLLLQTKKWLNYISPGVQIRVRDYLDLNLNEIRYLYNEGDYSTNEYKSSNVGFGITYTLPIIVALLAAKQHDLIIIENPEAHLHPAGQRKIGELLTRAATSGCQIIVETHSDHVLNGIRLGVKNEVLTSSDVNLFYFYKDIENDYMHKYAKPNILSSGKLDYWPEGFFDEWENALMDLY